MSRLVSKNRVQVPDSYMRLIRQFPLRPIRTDAEYDAAAAVMEKLSVRGERDLDIGQRDYLSVLSDLIENYDEAHYPIPADSRPAHEKLRALMLDQKMLPSDLAAILGAGRSLASLILSGKRQITAAHAKALGERFKLDAGYFL